MPISYFIYQRWHNHQIGMPALSLPLLNIHRAVCSLPESQLPCAIVSLWWHCLFRVPQILQSYHIRNLLPLQSTVEDDWRTDAREAFKESAKGWDMAVYTAKLKYDGLPRYFLHRKERGIFKLLEQENWCGILVDAAFGSWKKLLKLTSIRFSSSVDKTI